MSKSVRFGWLLVLASVSGVGLIGPQGSARAQSAAGPAVASVDQLETQAVDAFHQGQFDKGSALLTQAATVNDDPSVKRIAQWASDFQSQQQTFAVAREKEFEKDVKDVHTLLDHGMRSYAIDALREAYLRAPDKTAFRNEKWVNDLVAGAAADADQAEDNERWLTAVRIYSDLAGVDPS